MKNDRVIRSAGIVGGFTMLSRVLGLGRDVLMAGLFGTSLSMSAFVIAFTIPNLFRRLFGEGALSAAFVPVFVETRHEQGEQAAWALARKIITLVGLTLLIIVLLGELLIHFLPSVLPISEKWLMVLSLLRIMLPYMVFICLAALSMAILNAHRHFAVPAATPCLLNITWIAAVLLVAPRFSDESRIYIVAGAVLLAGLLQLGFQLPVLYRYGYRPGFALDLADRKVNRVLTLMGPAAMGLALTQINVLVDRALAGLIGEWAAAALYFSERLIYLPLGLFATALSTVLLPTFSAEAAGRNYRRIADTATHSLRNLLFIMIPAAVGLFVLARPIIETIYKWREFDAQSVWYTATALQCYAPGLVVFSLAKIFVPAFYALQDTRTPFRIGAVTVVINLVINLVFIATLPVAWKHAGIALATVIAEAFYAITLFILLQKKIGKLPLKAIGISLLKTASAACIMGVAAGSCSSILHHNAFLLSLPGKISEIAVTAGAVMVGLLTYLAAAIILRSPELRDMYSSLRKK